MCAWMRPHHRKPLPKRLRDTKAAVALCLCNVCMIVLLQKLIQFFSYRTYMTWGLSYSLWTAKWWPSSSLVITIDIYSLLWSSVFCFCQGYGKPYLHRTTAISCSGKRHWEVLQRIWKDSRHYAEKWLWLCGACSISFLFTIIYFVYHCSVFQSSLISERLLNLHSYRYYLILKLFLAIDGWNLHKCLKVLKCRHF